MSLKSLQIGRIQQADTQIKGLTIAPLNSRGKRRHTRFPMRRKIRIDGCNITPIQPGAKLCDRGRL